MEDAQPLLIQDCVERNRVPKVHAYPDHVFVVLHAPERDERGQRVTGSARAALGR
ncbi:hypothetical protein ACRYCC_18565 [Actinomadura scrupuli]|uniref:hypothetical protein n=1 Tax=Actinomadura scrupuli TaxID=559629 RepID=UPI003D996CF3